MTDLFSPLQLGALTVPNRVFMAPLTRARAGEAHLPNALMACLLYTSDAADE